MHCSASEPAPRAHRARQAMFMANTGLEAINLAYTRCGPESCLVLSDSLRHNTTLKRLHLDSNPLGEDGGRHLMTMLQVGG